MTSISDTVYAMAQGFLETPASNPDAHPFSRWAWYGDLYSHPEWGAPAVVPQFPSLIGGLVRDVCWATARRAPGTAECWAMLDQLAIQHREHAVDESERSVWEAMSATALDASDYLHGVEFGGVETVTTVFWAFLGRHTGPAAIQAAIAAWETHSHPRPQKVAA